jgi:hypothetical protein
VRRTFFIDTLREGGQVSAMKNLRRFHASILAQADMQFRAVSSFRADKTNHSG